MLFFPKEKSTNQILQLYAESLRKFALISSSSTPAASSSLTLSDTIKEVIDDFVSYVSESLGTDENTNVVQYRADIYRFKRIVDNVYQHDFINSNSKSVIGKFYKEASKAILEHFAHPIYISDNNFSRLELSQGVLIVCSICENWLVATAADDDDDDLKILRIFLDKNRRWGEAMRCFHFATEFSNEEEEYKVYNYRTALLSTEEVGGEMIDPLFEAEVASSLGMYLFNFLHENQRAYKLLQHAIKVGLIGASKLDKEGKKFFYPGGTTTLYRMEWFRSAQQAATELQEDVWIADQIAQEESRSSILASLQDDLSAMRTAAQGGPIRGGLKFIRHVFEYHPPRCDEDTAGKGQEYLAKVKEALERGCTGRGKNKPSAIIREILKPLKFLYHPDRNIGDDKKWTILCEQISMDLNTMMMKSIDNNEKRGEPKKKSV